MSEIIKVAFVGTSCAGKSTLLETCQEQMGDSAVFVDEAAREYFTEHPEITDRLSETVQGEVQALILRKEQVAYQQATESKQLRSIICDRSVLDSPSYVYSQGDEAGAQRLLERVQAWLPTYNRIFLMDPSDVPYVADDIRTEDEAMRQSFHSAFLDFFDKNELPFELLSGTIDERYARVSSFITQQFVTRH